MDLLAYAAAQKQNTGTPEAPAELKPEYKPLERQQQQDREAEERARQVYRTYQDNIKLSGELQTAILKGIKSGADITDLFLKACKAISLMTSNSVFYTQAEADLKAIYGIGLKQPGAIQKELDEVRQRLTMLTRPELQQEPEDSRNRINRAIKAHQDRENQLIELLKAGKAI